MSECIFADLCTPLVLLGTISLETSGDIRFRFVAHYVKVVATPEGPGVIWTPSLF